MQIFNGFPMHKSVACMAVAQDLRRLGACKAAQKRVVVGRPVLSLMARAGSLVPDRGDHMKDKFLPNI